MTTRIIGLPGSWRRGSFNHGLLRAAAEVAPEGVSMEVASIKEIPLYDGDLDAESGPPKVVEDLKDRIAAADALLLSSPEYNHSVPGVLKNAVDWLSRPAKDVRRVFFGKAVAVMGAAPGAGGTRFAQTAWLQIFHALGMRVFSGRQLYVAKAKELFDEDGRLVDEGIRERLARFVLELSELASS